MIEQSLASALETIRRAQGDPTQALRDGAVQAAVEEVVRVTADTYTRESTSYAELREQQPSEWDEYMTAVLLRAVREGIGSGRIPAPEGGRWRLLDVGAGHGRDLVRFAREPDIAPVALENAPGFIELLHTVEEEAGLPPGSVVAADMRDLSALDDETFHCIRSHATLHHMPVIAPGIGADLAIAESHRILVPGGILYVLVKAGDGVQAIDTREGIGKRFFQLFTPELLRAVIERNGFSVQRLEERIEKRPVGDIEWLFCLATCQ